MAIAVDQATLKRLARNLQPMLSSAGVELGHKQCLDFVSRLHEFRNFEEPKASSRSTGEPAPPNQSTPPWLEPPPVETDDTARRERVNSLARSIGPRLQQDPIGTCADLCSLVVAAVAKVHPGQQSAARSRLIRKKYPGATDALIAERSVDLEGLRHLTAFAQLLLDIGVCYSPDGTWVPAQIADEGTAIATAAAPLGKSITDAMHVACDQGLSWFGAMAVVTQIGAITARRSGVDIVSCLHVLQEALTRIWATRSRRASEAESVKQMSLLLGVSERQVRKYLPQA